MFPPRQRSGPARCGPAAPARSSFCCRCSSPAPRSSVPRSVLSSVSPPPGLCPVPGQRSTGAMWGWALFSERGAGPACSGRTVGSSGLRSPCARVRGGLHGGQGCGEVSPGFGTHSGLFRVPMRGEGQHMGQCPRPQFPVSSANSLFPPWLSHDRRSSPSLSHPRARARLAVHVPSFRFYVLESLWVYLFDQTHFYTNQ